MRSFLSILLFIAVSSFSFAQGNKELTVMVKEVDLPIASATIMYKTLENESLKIQTAQTNEYGYRKIEVSKIESKVEVNYGQTYEIVLMQQCDSLVLDIKKLRVVYFKAGKRLGKRKL